MTFRDQPLGLAPPVPRFATVFRGYDRDEVDSWLQEHETLAPERQTENTDALVAETSRREQLLESRLSELQLEEGHHPLPDSLVASVLDQAREVACEFPQRMLREAETDRESLRQEMADNLEEARALSSRILGAARRDREGAAALVSEARQQIDHFRQHASDAAHEHVLRTWEATTGALTEIELELAGIQARREILGAELAQLEQSLDESRAQLKERETAELEIANDLRPARAPGASVQQPRTSAPIPIEW